MVSNFYPDLDEAVTIAEKELESVKIEDEVTDEICELCGRNMVIKYGPHGKFLACPGFPDCKNTKPYLEKIGVPLSQVRQRGGAQEDEKGPSYYGCEANPTVTSCPGRSLPLKKCPKCGSYMVEKGSKLLCAG